MSDRAADILASSPPLEQTAIVTDTCTDSTLAHLAKSKSLSGLYLGSNEITDAGFLALGAMKQLRVVHFVLPKVSKQAIAELQKELPKAYIGK